MSAFLVSQTHIDALVRTAMRGTSDNANEHKQWWPCYFDGMTVNTFSADTVGLKLWRECAASVTARYPRNPESIAEYRYEDGSLFTGVQALKLIACYEYQSCEHDGWETSQAKTFCDSLRNSVIAHLPGYDDAEWSL